MAVVFNKRNNIKLEIKAPMTSVWTLLVVDKWTLLWEDFANDETKNFSLTLFKLEWDVPVQIEISEVIAKSGNNLTLRRAVEPCPMNYWAWEMVQQAYDFDVWDVAYMNLTAGDIENMVKEFEKINKNLTDNYLKTSDFNALKWQPWWIATLGNDWKIPSNQIDTSSISVWWLEYEYTAWENIQKWDYLCVWHKELLETVNLNNIEYKFWYGSTEPAETARTYNQTFTLTKSWKWRIYYKADIRTASSYSFRYLCLQLRQNWNVVYEDNTMDTVQDDGAIFYMDFDINNNLQAGNIEVYTKVKRYSSQYSQSYNTKLLTEVKIDVISDTKEWKIYKYNWTNAQNWVYIWQALANTTSWQKVKTSSLMTKIQSTALSELYINNSNKIIQVAKDTIWKKFIYTVDWQTWIYFDWTWKTKSVSCNFNPQINTQNLTKQYPLYRVPIFVWVRPKTITYSWWLSWTLDFTANNSAQIYNNWYSNSRQIYIVWADKDYIYLQQWYVWTTFTFNIEF